MKHSSPEAPPRIALLMLGLNELGGGGGAERFFADVFDRFNTRTGNRVVPRLLVDGRSLQRLQKVGRVNRRDNVRALSATTLWGQVRELCSCLREQGIALIHVPLIAPQYLPLLYLIKLTGPRIPVTITAVSCDLAHRRGRLGFPGGMEELKIRILYWTYFKTLALGGVYSWYRLLVERLQRERLPGDPVLASAPCFFVDTERFRPAQPKQPIIVFAARLSPQKRPLLFIEGLRLARERWPELFAGWRVEIYGQGVLSRRLKDTIVESGLDDLVTMKSSGVLADVFARSRLFVSTQDYENFSSVSMLEAMACGNAIIARNVGQTREYVRDGENGLLLSEDNAEGLARAIIAYLAVPECHRSYAERSRAIAVNEQRAERFLGHLEAFWLEVLARRKRREQ